MKTLEKERYFNIHEDQWGSQGLVLKTDGTVVLEAMDRKDGGDTTLHMGVWQDFMEAYIDSPDAVYQQVAQYIKDNLLA
jgi:hypothetical protein